MILHILIAMVAGWLQRHQQQVITYLLEENRVLKAHPGGRRLRLTDTERRRLATLAHPLDRSCTPTLRINRSARNLAKRPRILLPLLSKWLEAMP